MWSLVQDVAGSGLALAVAAKGAIRPGTSMIFCCHFIYSGLVLLQPDIPGSTPPFFKHSVAIVHDIVLS